MKTRRCAVWVWYRGDRFCGFQTQLQGPTVQQTLMDAVQSLGVRPVVMGSGRTDRGVHARMQVVSMNCPAEESLDAFIARLSAALPGDALGIVRAVLPHPSFHAQWSARGKEYRYRFAFSDDAAAWRPFAWRLFGTGPERVQEVLQRAVGTRDFRAFHGKSSVLRPRTLERVTFRELGGGIYEAALLGDSFGKYMVRFLVGAAVKVATGELPLETFDLALSEGRMFRRMRAPAEGLVLWDVRYPQELDPFDAPAREEASGVPREPPFY